MGAAANDGSPAERCSRPSAGAAMSVGASGGGGGSRSCGCCCINIYVNNNVQGVTNSVLVGSKVAMRDPGARLRLRHPPAPARHAPCRRSKRNKKAAATSMSSLFATSAAMVFIATLLLLLLLLLLLIFCAWICR
ncbi:hypothetical protein GUJ93_ZPchr0010g11272 [Zizania palustris]|uniref:Uncharacterized protein n=1 Tax=Zizania palustris TaxID=103762 RepID=A0A8J6BC72_ZIZPA|nr:hypothetical protein GUJ93_ZPchr0010g11272 [Zizania palustris]